MKKLDEEVTDIEDRVPDIGTMVKDFKLLKICSTRIRSIVVGCFGAMIMHLATC